MGCCLWGLPQDPDKPKPKSNQEQLKSEFDNHAE